MCVTVNAYAKTLADKARNNVIVQPTKHLAVTEQPTHANLDVHSSSASEGGPVSGSLNDATTSVGGKGNRVLVVETKRYHLIFSHMNVIKFKKRFHNELTGSGAQ